MREIFHYRDDLCECELWTLAFVSLTLFLVVIVASSILQEDANRGKPNWEHLSDELHVLITVEDTENRAHMKLERAVEEVKKLLVPVSISFTSHTTSKILKYILHGCFN